MQTDTYTKTVLTEIAAGVLFIAFRDVPVIGNAQAQDLTKIIDVNIKAVAGHQVNDPDKSALVFALPVRVINK